MARTRATPPASPPDAESAPSAPPARRISATEFVREEPLTAALRGIVLTVYPHKKLTRTEWTDLLTQTLQRPTP